RGREREGVAGSRPAGVGAGGGEERGEEREKRREIKGKREKRGSPAAGRP
ncbi:hypothetical protein TIFTF001_043253, partial [Ficus carica]